MYVPSVVEYSIAAGSTLICMCGPTMYMYFKVNNQSYHSRPWDQPKW